MELAYPSDSEEEQNEKPSHFVHFYLQLEPLLSYLGECSDHSIPGIGVDLDNHNNWYYAFANQYGEEKPLTVH